MKEIGGYLPLELARGKEYYNGENVLRLNSARAGILYSVKDMNIQKIYLPAYCCTVVYKFLELYNITYNFYHIDEDFLPELDNIENDTAILWVNYFGLMGERRLKTIVSRYKNVIIDNTQAFFEPAMSGAYNVYSCYKFLGVPDGSYLVKDGIDSNIPLEPSFSYKTSNYLLQALDCSTNAAYAGYLENIEKQKTAMLSMSKLTHRLLQSINYESIKSKRVQNFKYLESRLKTINQLYLPLWDDCIPMIYPLLLNIDLHEFLVSKKIYVPRWWKNTSGKYLYNPLESQLSEFLVALPIDQRYDENDMEYVASIILSFIEKEN